MKTSNASSAVYLVLLLLLLQQVQLVSCVTCDGTCYSLVILSSVFGTPLFCGACIACICVCVIYTCREVERQFLLQRRRNGNQVTVTPNQTTSAKFNVVVKLDDIETGIVDPKPISEIYVETVATPPTYDIAVFGHSSDTGAVNQDTISQPEGPADH